MNRYPAYSVPLVPMAMPLVRHARPPRSFYGQPQITRGPSFVHPTNGFQRASLFNSPDAYGSRKRPYQSDNREYQPEKRPYQPDSRLFYEGGRAYQQGSSHYGQGIRPLLPSVATSYHSDNIARPPDNVSNQHGTRQDVQSALRNKSYRHENRPSHTAATAAGQRESRPSPSVPPSQCDNRPSSTAAPIQRDSRPAVASSQQDSRPSTSVPPSQRDSRPTASLIQQDNRPSSTIASSQQDNRSSLTGPPSQQDSRPSSTAAPSQQDSRPASTAAPSQQDNRPTSTIPPTKRDNRPTSTIPPTKRDNRPTSTIPPTQRDNRPSSTAASSQRDNRTSIAAASQRDNRPSSVATSSQQDSKPFQTAISNQCESKTHQHGNQSYQSTKQNNELYQQYDKSSFSGNCLKTQADWEENVDELQGDNSATVLDHYNSDLNLIVDSNGYGAEALTNPPGFCFCWAGARATYGVTRGKIFFEVYITDHLSVQFGDGHQEANPHVVRVGWSVDSYSFQLGEDPDSYGYGGTGKFSTNLKFSDYGEAFGAGDVIGTLLDFQSFPPTISYTKNGRWLGNAIALHGYRVGVTVKALFPHVLVKNCRIQVNFGQRDPWFAPPPGYVYIDHIPLADRVHGQKGPSKKEDCEMLMIVGLPGAGKTTYGLNTQLGHPEKRYNIIGTDTLIEKMKVMGLPRKRNYSGRWEVLIKKATQCLNTLFEIGGCRKRNYILDQTNVYASARRRKMRYFAGFIRKAVVIVPEDPEFQRRSLKRTVEDGKYVPEEAVIEMKANFSLPAEGVDPFDIICFVELGRDMAQVLVQGYNSEGEEKRPPRAVVFRHDTRKSSRPGTGGAQSTNSLVCSGDQTKVTNPDPQTGTCPDLTGDYGKQDSTTVAKTTASAANPDGSVDNKAQKGGKPDDVSDKAKDHTVSGGQTVKVEPGNSEHVGQRHRSQSSERHGHRSRSRSKDSRERRSVSRHHSRSSRRSSERHERRRSRSSERRERRDSYGSRHDRSDRRDYRRSPKGTDGRSSSYEQHSKSGYQSEWGESRRSSKERLQWEPQETGTEARQQLWSSCPIKQVPRSSSNYGSLMESQANQGIVKTEPEVAKTSNLYPQSYASQQYPFSMGSTNKPLPSRSSTDADFFGKSDVDYRFQFSTSSAYDKGVGYGANALPVPTRSNSVTSQSMKTVTHLSSAANPQQYGFPVAQNLGMGSQFSQHQPFTARGTDARTIMGGRDYNQQSQTSSQMDYNSRLTQATTNYSQQSYDPSAAQRLNYGYSQQATQQVDYYSQALARNSTSYNQKPSEMGGSSSYGSKFVPSEEPVSYGQRSVQSENTRNVNIPLQGSENSGNYSSQPQYRDYGAASGYAQLYNSSVQSTSYMYPQQSSSTDFHAKYSHLYKSSDPRSVSSQQYDASLNAKPLQPSTTGDFFHTSKTPDRTSNKQYSAYGGDQGTIPYQQQAGQLSFDSKYQPMQPAGTGNEKPMHSYGFADTAVYSRDNYRHSTGDNYSVQPGAGQVDAHSQYAAMSIKPYEHHNWPKSGNPAQKLDPYYAQPAAKDNSQERYRPYQTEEVSRQTNLGVPQQGYYTPGTHQQLNPTNYTLQL